MAFFQPHSIFRTALLGLVLLFVVACSSSSGSDIEFSGEITNINGTLITVAEFTVNTSGAAVPTSPLEVGMNVQVSGTLEGEIIQAKTIVLVEEQEDDDDSSDAEPPAASDEPSPEATDDDSADATAEVSPEATDDSTPEPAPTDENGEIIPIIVIEGPVEEISVNYIVIFGNQIQVDPADPILTEIRIGDTIRIEGTSSFENGIIIIIAFNITIVETTVIIVNNPVYVAPGLPANCRLKKSGRITCKNSRRT